MMAGLKSLARQWLLDRLGEREDRYYWRQPVSEFDLPPDATLCLWQPDGKLGDSVIHTILVDNIARQRPDVRLVVVCAPALVPFWERIPGVWKAVSAPVAKDAARTVLSMLDRVDVFVSLEAFVSLETLAFMRKIKAAITVGLSVGRYKAFTHAVADHTYDHPRQHVTQRLRGLCTLMRLDYQATNALAQVAQAVPAPMALQGASVRPAVFLNIYGAGPQKLFSEETVAWLMARIGRAMPDAHLIVNVPDAQRDGFSPSLSGETLPPWTLAPRGMSLWTLIALVQQCRAVVTPDTAIGHIAAALDLPVTVFFEDAHYTPVVWAPVGDKLRIVAPSRQGNVNNFDKAQAEGAIGFMLAQAQADDTAPGSRTLHRVVQHG